jgi:lysophospholipase L1-like esterase
MAMRASQPGRTRIIFIFALIAGVLISLTRPLFCQSELGDAQTFAAAGSPCRVLVRTHPAGGTAVILQSRGGERAISPPGGENLFPKVQICGDHFYVLWVRYQAGRAFLGLYDSRTGSAGRIIPILGLSFLGSPVLVEDAPFPGGVVFLGNASDNDDIFYYDLFLGRLVNLTKTPASEKLFTIERASGGILISTETLHERTLMGFDFRTTTVRILSRETLKSFGGRSGSHQSADDSDAARIANTYVAFGDSITWGKMRINGLEGEYHPELAYPDKMVEALEPIYGPAYPVNLGVPGETTFDGARRVEADLEATDGAYFLLMMGTNDVVHGAFSVDSIMENILFIISVAEAREMRVIISTIPPRKDALGINPEIHQNILDLNARIAEFAESRAIGFIDTFGTFMAYNFPDGWMSLLEDVGGNHPNPAGHVLIASLFADRLIAFAPRTPSAIEKSITVKPAHWKIQWQACLESDFSCYRLEYGPTEAMTNFAVLTENSFVFPGFLSRKTFFRLQSVDNAGHRSGFAGIRSTSERERSNSGSAPHRKEIIRGS